jgi:hypothetical protein
VSLWLPGLLVHLFLLLVLPELQHDPGLLVPLELLLLLLEHLWHLVCLWHLVLRYSPWEDPVLLWHLVLQRLLGLLDYPEQHFVLQWLPELLLLLGHRCFPGVPLELLELL